MAFDEAMPPSRSSFNRMRIFMKEKPHKWGTKLFMLNCSSTAYCIRRVAEHALVFEPYLVNIALFKDKRRLIRRLDQLPLHRIFITYLERPIIRPCD
ncbi:hypothetical protein PHMEG_0007077 [Phytophthora megakarya]|uniref:PiggyBac transposable element-derived protein domain-containing protein n=1 Tax=Phytophthora megakarya TaxID=4795 RepID=A0A225WM86_9STRA|nr:hypothetical protein PHMEG_0007077 [Phytophthora megakarya]